MKKLYLIRHGQAEDKGSRPDFDRNLEKEGRAEVARTAAEMVRRQIQPSLILSSPANRAIQIAEIVANTIGYKLSDIVLERDIYYTDTSKLLEILHQQEDKYESILLAGHNPSITHLAGMLTSDYNDLIPTGGLVAFETEAPSWDHFEKNKTSFLFCIYP